MAKYIYREVYITRDETWVAPEAKDQAFEVKVYGGGGSGSCDGNFFGPVSGAGGGAGYMNTAILTIPKGTRVEVEIGAGGPGCHGITASDFEGQMIGQTGGTTYFGEYLSAAGGAGGYRSTGGKGGYNGGDTGKDGEGHGGSACTAEVDGITYISGGGAGAVDGVGRGGSADVACGDAGCAAGGAGCMVVEVNETGIIKHIGSGGPGLCIIKFEQKV